MVKAKLANHVLVYAAEVDCCSSKEHTSLNDYCELKTCRGESIKDLNFERNPKFFKWFIQSHLIGTQTFQIGLRNDDGLVKKIVNLNKDDLSKHVNKRSSHKMCFNFLKKFFDLVKEFCLEDNRLYIAKRTINNDRIELFKVNENSNDYEKHYFMHTWYRNVI